jgi:hypothetical protein
MTLSKGLQSFWQLFGFCAGAGVLVTGLVYWRLGWLPGLFVLALAIAGTTVLLSLIKASLLKAMPEDWQHYGVSRVDITSFDRRWFQQQAQRLDELGFKKLKDYKLKDETSTSLARLFVHPQRSCFVEIGERVAPESTIKNTVIISLFDDDWILACNHRNTQASIDSLGYSWRDPKTVQIFDPSLELKDVFNQHLVLRKQIRSDLGIGLDRNLDWERYIALEQQQTRQRKQRFHQKPLLQTMIEATLYEFNPNPRWLGDYGKKRSKAKFNPEFKPG